MGKTKWLLDTDIGNDNDDCMALGYLLTANDVDLLGVTTVTGDNERRAMLADVMCRLAGRRVPIYPGCEGPLIGALQQNRMVKAEAEQVNLYPHQEHFPKSQAIIFLKETIETYPHEVVLAAIGPLTNIALLFATYPHIPALLKSLVVMGGRYFETDACDINKWGFVEWNIKGDPYAASIVFSAKTAATLVIGVETSCQLKMEGALTAQTISAIPCMRPIASVVKGWEYAWFHDALAVWLYTNQEKGNWAQGDISVLLDSPSQLGTTVFTPNPDGTHRLLTHVDSEDFFQGYAASMGICWSQP